MAEDDEQKSAAPVLCGVCRCDIDTEDEYIEASCTACGRHSFHTECVTPLLVRIHHDSTRAMERARRMIAVRPAYYMAQQRLQCPIALTNDSIACGGRIVDADVVKPVKASPPPPPGLPAPAARGKKKGGGGGSPAAAPPAGRARAAAAPTPSGPTKKQQREQQRATATALRASAAPDYARESAGSSGLSGGGGAAAAIRAGGVQPHGAKLKFPPGQRPVGLQRRQDFDECGECFIHRCPRCHGDEELQQREREWVAQQEAKKREKRQEELARHEAALAARAEQAEWEEQAAARERERLEHEESYLQMGDAPLRLMKDYKRSACVASLLEMGFSPAKAAVAAEAAGCDISAAAALVSEGRPIMGSKPVSVTGEAQELLAYAASLGLGLPDVEIALMLAGGSWDEARAQLHDQAEAAAVAASTAEAEAALRAEAAAGSREEAELQAALQASASSAALAYNSARAAAAAATAEREQADLAAALEASKAEEEVRQADLRSQQHQQPVLPWSVPSPSPYSLGSHAGAAEWGMGTLAAAAQQTAAPPAQQQQQWLYEEATKAPVPTYSGGWDVGPADVAAASGRSSSACAGPQADPWQQGVASQPTGLPGAALGLFTAFSGPGAAVPSQTLEPAVPDSWSASPSPHPLAKPHAEGSASLGIFSGWEVRPPAPVPAASKDQSSDVEKLMAMMGIG